jgi:hypothetical protein
MTDASSIPAVLAPRAMPDPKAFLNEIQQSVHHANWFQQLMRENEEQRTCWWAGQSADGRKHSTQNSRARPWENAADHRVPVLLQLMKERTAVRKRAMKSAKLTIKGRTMDDQAKAALLKQVVEYHLKTEMGSEVGDEAEYWSNWSQNYGHSVLFVGWKTERQLEPRLLKLQNLQQFAAALELARVSRERLAAGAPLDQGDVPEIERVAMQAVLEKLETPQGRKELSEVVLQLDPDLQAMGRQGVAEIMRALNELRTAEEAEYLCSYLKTSRPEWEALQPYVDVFYPSQTKKVSESRWVVRVRWLDEVALRSWAADEGLNEDWLREVLKHPGKCMDMTGLADWVLSASGTRMGRQTISYTQETQGRYYQIAEVYWRAFTSYGVPVLYRTIAHGMVQTGFGKHEVCRHYNGNQPFFDMREERWSKLLLDSRGVPEVFGTFQHAIKSQWDSRTDAASLSTVPPMTGPAGSRAPDIGPGVYVENYRSGSVEWMKPPPPDGRSIEIERTITTRLNRFYGLMSEDVPEPLQILIQGNLSDDFLESIKGVLMMTVQLIQQYTPDLKGARITGSDDYVTATRDEIQGMFDIEVDWDVKDLSLEWVEQKLTFYKDMLLPLDNRGLINREEMIRAGAEAVDPVAAKRFITPGAQVDARDTKEEEDALSAIFSGGLPKFVVGVNHELRSQIMQQDLAESPTRRRILEMNEDITRVWEDRLQRHLFQLEQDQNKIAGIQGGADPLRQSPLAQLKAQGWRAFAGPQQQQQEAPVAA